MSKILILHSDKSDNNQYALDKRIEGIYRFKSFVATNNMYNNNKIYINENSIDYEISLTNGYYDATDLTSHLSTKLNDGLSGTVSVTFDTNTNKFTFTDTLPINFTFGTNTSNSSRKLLGFNAVDGTASTTQNSDVPVDLNPCKNIFLTITEDDNRNVEGIDFFNCSLVVNGATGFGEIMRYIDVDNFTQTLKFKRTKKISISFHDASNNNINLNSEYQIILQKIE